MKKTVRWTVLFSLLLLCALIPAMAQGAGAAEELWIGDTQVTDVTQNASGEGWTYTASSIMSTVVGTLKLDSPAITGSHPVGAGSEEKAIIYTSGIDLTLEGTLALNRSTAEYGVYVAADGSGGVLTISGADLTVTSEKACLWADVEIVISDSTVKATATGDSGCAVSAADIITISNAKVTAAATGGSGYGIFTKGKVMVSGSSSDVTAEGTTDGIHAVQSIFIESGKVSAKGGSQTGMETAHEMTIQDGAAVKAEGAVLGIAAGTFTFSGSDTVVTADGGEAAVFVGDKTIDIQSPLLILEPDGGMIASYKDWYNAICESDGRTAATHAVIAKKKPTYTVTWIIDGMSETETYAYGETPVHADPAKAPDVIYTYTFTGWVPAIVPVTEDATYVAQFEAVPSTLGPFSPLSQFYPVSGGKAIRGGLGTPDLAAPDGPAAPDDSGILVDSGAPKIGPLPFADVSSDSPYYDDIRFVYENNLMNGMSGTEFCEEIPLTRGMIVTILHRVEGRPEVPYAGAFSDVPEGEWYTEGVEWAAFHGIILGYGNGHCGPDDFVTREQLSAILIRYAEYKGYDTSVGEDTNILSYDDAFTWGDWAVSALQWACGTDVLNSGDTALLRPTEAATRGEIAHAIHVFVEDVSK